MDKSKLKNVIKTICYNEHLKNGSYVAPFLNLTIDPITNKAQDPIFEEKEFDEFLEEISEQIISQTAFLSEERIICESLKELLFDGRGFFVPCFACYVNARTEHQKENDVKYKNNVPVGFYNWDKDIPFNVMLFELCENLNDLDSWINKKKTSHTIEFIDAMNTDNKRLSSFLEQYKKQKTVDGSK
jgi:hypothetical protein